jgi:predicted ester cyclase
MAPADEAVIRRYYEATSRGDHGALEQVLDPNFVLHSPISDQPITGVQGYKDMISTYLNASPGLSIHVDELNIDGDTARVRWTARYHHTGDFRGHQATDRQGSLSGSDTIRLAGGRIAEVWNELDLGEAEQQLGFSPKLS